LATTALSVGSHTITASYSGDANFLSSSSQGLTQVVSQGNSTVSLASNKTFAAIGHTVVFTVVVTPVAPATGSPGGTVTFLDSGTPIGTAAVSGGQAVLAYVFPGGAGTHTLTASYSGDSNFTGSTSAPFTQLVYTLNQAFVAQVYLDLLHRPVDPTGLAFWSSLLDQGTSPPQVVLDIEGSLEYKTVQVETMYTHFLHRNADPFGLSSFTGMLLAGATVEQVEAIIVGSPEYYATRGGGTDEGFLNAVYNDVLNRNIDPTGNAVDLLLLEQFTPRSTVAGLVLNSLEGRQVLVTSYYQTFLRRGPDTGGLNFFTDLLLSGVRDEQVIAMIVGSEEYLGKL
jgi:hypothetical protein